VSALHLLASEGIKNANLWNPTILGFLVVLSAIGLFCGSVYLLLATNLGARLGFLIAAACLTGFLVLLSVTWMTTSTPNTSPHGRASEWKVVEVVSAPGDAQLKDAGSIDERGRVVSEEQLALLRPAIDAALVTVQPVAGEEPHEQPLAQFGSSTDFLTEVDGEPIRAHVVGGNSKRLFWHEPEHAVVAFCPTLKPTPIGEAPRCDPLKDVQYAVLEHDLGTLRQPTFMYFASFLVLFLLSLAGLHWHEKDARARRRATLTPVPTTAPVTTS
jgi:hypothetical protein